MAISEIAILSKDAEHNLECLKRCTRIVLRWKNLLLLPDEEFIMRPIVHLLKKIKRKDLQSLCEQIEQDDWYGVLKSVDFFREVFEVEIPVEALVTDDVPDEEAKRWSYYYEYSRDDWTITNSTILIPRQTFQQVYPCRQILAITAHEVWHAAQLQTQLTWEKTHMLPECNLEEIDFNQPEERGALYTLCRMYYLLIERGSLLEQEACFVEDWVRKN